MKKIIIFIFLIIVLAGCNQSNVIHNTELEKAISSIVEDNDKREVKIKSLTDFSWEKAFLITPYSTEEVIEKQLGVDFKDPSNIDRRDDIYLLVFLNDNKVVQYAEIERQGSDFTIGNKRYLTPTEDLISIERR